MYIFYVDLLPMNSQINAGIWGGGCQLHKGKQRLAHPNHCMNNQFGVIVKSTEIKRLWVLIPPQGQLLFVRQWQNISKKNFPKKTSGTSPGNRVSKTDLKAPPKINMLEFQIYMYLNGLLILPIPFVLIFFSTCTVGFRPVMEWNTVLYFLKKKKSFFFLSSVEKARISSWFQQHHKKSS